MIHKRGKSLVFSNIVSLTDFLRPTNFENITNVELNISHVIMHHMLQPLSLTSYWELGNRVYGK